MDIKDGSIVLAKNMDWFVVKIKGDIVSLRRIHNDNLYANITINKNEIQEVIKL